MPHALGWDLELRSWSLQDIKGLVVLFIKAIELIWRPDQIPQAISMDKIFFRPPSIISGIVLLCAVKHLPSFTPEVASFQIWIKWSHAVYEALSILWRVCQHRYTGIAIQYRYYHTPPHPRQWRWHLYLQEFICWYSLNQFPKGSKLHEQKEFFAVKLHLPKGFCWHNCVKGVIFFFSHS